MKKKVLTLTVSKEWFDMIVADEKTEEYREIKPYWIKRLTTNCEVAYDVAAETYCGKVLYRPYTHVLFINGYRKDSPRIEKEIESISIGKPKKGMCPEEWLDTEFLLLCSSDMIAIKVSSENIQELWKCPDVSELVKTVSGDCTKQTLIVRLRNREFYVPYGFYLVIDENGRWSTLSPSLYELIKDKVHGEK